MKINHTQSNQNFTSLILNKAGISTLADADVHSLAKFRNRMEKHKYFDFEVNAEGAFICPKGSDAKFGPHYTLESPYVPKGRDFTMMTTVQRGDGESGEVGLYLDYIQNDVAQDAYRRFKSKDDFWKAVQLIDKLDQDAAIRQRKALNRMA